MTNNPYSHMLDCLDRARNALLNADNIARELVRDSALSPQDRDKVGAACGSLEIAMNAIRKRAIDYGRNTYSG